ncbi:MAG: D-alanyl-D-alanine carboxypeptidase (penicillin-binding protein 5/6) [Verrucomicrobiales bacterium]|jgi:D-alanyl-D-alanine carboxypeptidase (penicillin-binding protein 5/6)
MASPTAFIRRSSIFAIVAATCVILAGCQSSRLPAYKSTTQPAWQQYGSGHSTANQNYRPPAPTPPRPQGPVSDVPFPATFQAPANAPTIRAQSWVLLDARSGRTLAYKNLDARRAVASTQKLVTALVILDSGNLDKPITITSADTKVEPSKMYLKAGQRFTRRQLLSVFLVKSANDAAMALARDHSGNTHAFGIAMTRKARQLGAYQTSFKNPHGLTESGQYSTARDMAKIAYFAYRHSFIRSIVGRQKYTLNCAYGVRHYNNTNKLLARMPGCNGMKTGYTNASGRCLISSASRSGRDVILVQLGTKTEYIWDDGKKLMEWGLQRSR